MAGYADDHYFHFQLKSWGTKTLNILLSIVGINSVTWTSLKD